MAHQRIYLDFTKLNIPEEFNHLKEDFIKNVNDKVINAFKGTPVEVTLEPPASGSYSPIEITNENLFGYYGKASSVDFGNANPNDSAFASIKDIYSTNPSLSYDQLTNFASRTIVHEAGHLVGLEHTNDPNDIMADGEILDRFIYKNNPPEFSLQQRLAITANTIEVDEITSCNALYRETDNLHAEDIDIIDIDVSDSDFSDVDGLDLDGDETSDIPIE